MSESNQLSVMKSSCYAVLLLLSSFDLDPVMEQFELFGLKSSLGSVDRLVQKFPEYRVSIRPIILTASHVFVLFSMFFWQCKPLPEVLIFKPTVG